MRQFFPCQTGDQSPNFAQGPNAATASCKKERPLGISALTPPTRAEDIVETLLEFPDNRLLIDLCGEFDRNLSQVEHQLGVHVLRRGNRLAVIGDKSHREQAAAVLRGLYAKLEGGRSVTAGDVDGALRLGRPAALGARADADQIEMFHGSELRTRKRAIEPRTEAQKAYVANLFAHELGFGIGPAGTGKTYLAVAVGVTMFISGAVEKIVLSRVRSVWSTNSLRCWSSVPPAPCSMHLGSPVVPEENITYRG